MEHFIVVSFENGLTSFNDERPGCANDKKEGESLLFMSIANTSSCLRIALLNEGRTSESIG